MIGTTVAKIYNRLQTPMGAKVLIPTVVLILNSESLSPAKNRNGDVKATRYSLGHLWHVPSFASFEQVLADSKILQRIAVSLEDMHITANPLPNEDRQECRQKAEDEGHEPENIDTDI